MINVEPFKAKLVADPKTREAGSRPVCNMRVRQIDPGKPSLFIDLAVFGEELAKKCAALVKGTEFDVSSAGLIYKEWESKPKGKSKPQKRSKHSLIATEIAFAE
jgi:hypothetical protein